MLQSCCSKERSMEFPANKLMKLKGAPSREGSCSQSSRVANAAA
jgi:hypothetical protein